MQELIIDRVEKKTPKSGGNPFFIVHGEGGEEMTTFDAAIANFGKGTKLNVEPKVSGKYVNIEKYEVLSATEVGKLTGNGGGYKKDIEGMKLEYQLKAQLQAVERVSIEGQNALTNLVKLLSEGDIHLSDAVREEVKLAYKTIKAKIEAYTSKAVETPVVTEPKPTPAPKTTSDIPEFKTGVELTNYALKHGYTLDKIKEYLSINNPIEITDVKAAKEVLFPSEKD